MWSFKTVILWILVVLSCDFVCVEAKETIHTGFKIILKLPIPTTKEEKQTIKRLYQLISQVVNHQIQFSAADFTVFNRTTILTTFDKMCKIPKDDNDNNDHKRMTDKWLRVSQKIRHHEENVMQLNLLIKIFDVLLNTINYVNAIFEFPILSFIFTAVVEIFQVMNYTIAYATNSLTDKLWANLNFVILRLFWCLFILMLAMVIIKRSLRLEYEIHTITNQLYKKLLEMPSEKLLRDEAQETLTLLHQQFMERSFHVSGVFFKLDNSFLVDMFMIITSCIPVIVQFNRVEIS
ncbi:hypothetical protein RN001_004943 [Aquatica leii]|uniref:Gustatory receptor n=1 Tax=Aquatica leii TaxID=1421715 RepID=A0AAN7SI99_9COLE|nr:hypothetical protein RN001_004943 [Aquatica leii]